MSVALASSLDSARAQLYAFQTLSISVFAVSLR